MTYKSADNVVEQSTTTTTGAYQLGGVPSSGEQPGAQIFVSGIGNGNSCDYYASEVAGTAWERGIGTVTDASTDTLSRDTITGSSNSGSAVDWTGKTLRVRCILPARRVNNASSNILENLTIATSRASNAETISLKTLYGTDPAANDPMRAGFVDPSTGAFFLREAVSAASITIPSGATLGATSAEPFRLWLVLFDDSGTLRPGVIKCYTGTGIVGLEDNGVASSTAISSSATSAGVFYTGTAVTSKPYRILGRLDYTLTTAGTWVTAPTIKLFSQGSKLPGDVVTFGRNSTLSVVDCNAVTPYDDTIPQSAEVVQIVSCSITPKSACNLIRVNGEFSGQLSSSGAGSVACIFKNSGASASRVAITYSPGSSPVVSPVLGLVEIANSISSTTYALCCGLTSSQSLYVNGSSSGGRAFGGIMESFISIEEIMV